MTHIEIWLMALALAMDCFAVSIASGILFKKVVWRPMLTMAFLFGFFQALNPFLGWWGTDLCRDLIESVDHWVAFAILGFLGVRMIVESFKEEEKKRFNPRRYKVIFTLAIATSIDALAVGISFSCMGYHSAASLCYPLAIIFLVSFLLTIIGLGLGLKFGNGFAKKLRAELCGGIILLLIGVRVLVEHLCSN
ncbi:MAG: manganese efflux pump [Bacteroidaceae bacterium]|nr:manganese efflux pump [Bacteroidaceae bacterium]